MRLRITTDNLEPFEAHVNIADYFPKERLERQVDIWQKEGSTFDEFLDWVTDVIGAEYGYKVNNEIDYDAGFTVDVLEYSKTELYMLDALWYG